MSVLTLENIKPSTFLSITYPESTIFKNTTEQIKNFVDLKLNQKAKELGQDYKVKSEKKGNKIYASVFHKDEKKYKENIHILMMANAINILQEDITNANSFCDYTADLAYSILEEIDRKKVNDLAVLFIIEGGLKKGSSLSEHVKKIKFYFNNKLINIRSVEENINDLKFNLEFKQDDCFCNFSIRTEKIGESNQLQGAIGANIYKKYQDKELTIMNADTISIFLKDQAVKYFLDKIANGIAKDVFESIIKKDKK
jgi:hypothetical protein